MGPDEAVIEITIPAKYARDMEERSGGFYLDVFHCVRDSETWEAIGEWRERR